MDDVNSGKQPDHSQRRIKNNARRHHGERQMELVGLGWYFEDMTVGRQYRTIGRTVTETDIINFVNCTGLTEVFFINREAIENESAFGRRFAPAALCYCFSEALIAQATLQYTGLAMLHLELDIKGPVFADDTIHAECEVVAARLSRKDGSRGIVTTRVRIVKQDGAVAYEYLPTRLIKCRPQQST
jgi:acyl dehydratase